MECVVRVINVLHIRFSGEVCVRGDIVWETWGPGN